MNCFEPHTEPTVAVAMCHHCGAALCSEHAAAKMKHLFKTVPLNRRVPIEPPARVILCPTCLAATQAAAAAA